jgi:hypothetical protein
MNDPVTVQVVQGVHQLLRNLSDFVFSQVSVVFQDLKKLSLSELGDNAEFVGGLEGVEE